MGVGVGRGVAGRLIGLAVGKPTGVLVAVDALPHPLTSAVRVAKVRIKALMA